MHNRSNYLPSDVEALVVPIMVQAHGGLQTVSQTLQAETIRALLHQLLQLCQHGLQGGLSFHHTAQSLWKDDLTEVGVQFLQCRKRHISVRNSYIFLYLHTHKNRTIT